MCVLIYKTNYLSVSPRVLYSLVGFIIDLLEHVVQPGNADGNKLFHSLFRRPDKFKIGDDFDLFIKKLELYFEAVELVDEKKRRFALLFNIILTRTLFAWRVSRVH